MNIQLMCIQNVVIDILPACIVQLPHAKVHEMPHVVDQLLLDILMVRWYGAWRHGACPIPVSDMY